MSSCYDPKKPGRVLVACEFSATVRDAFRSRGHDAWSCDLLPCEGDPAYHIQGDVLEILNDGWDMMIAHPPCTYLCSSGLHWNKRVSGRDKLTHEAMLFVMNLMGDGFVSHDIKLVALENPVGCISTQYRKPDQCIQPYEFGENASKKTCFWLKGLPPLISTKMVDPEYGCSCGHRFDYSLGKYGCPNCNGSGKTRPVWANQTTGGQNKLGPSEMRWAERSRTYPGIAAAMADQWGPLIGRAIGGAGA